MDKLNTFDILLFAMGLSMDAFAVSICKGLSFGTITMKKAGTVGLYFGLFQAGMPMLGYALGRGFYEQIAGFDHWIAFVLLLAVGIKMIRESREETSHYMATVGVGEMLVLSVATSIDALAVGITFAFFGLNIIQACMMIGITTFVFSVVGVNIGHMFGLKYKAPAELAGGFILIGIGLNTLIGQLI